MQRDTTQLTPRASPEDQGAPVRLGLITVILATACGLAVANIYFAQPILDLLAGSFHTSQAAATTAVTDLAVRTVNA